MLNGEGLTPCHASTSTPTALAIDSGRRKLYWLSNTATSTLTINQLEYNTAECDASRYALIHPYHPLLLVCLHLYIILSSLYAFTRIIIILSSLYAFTRISSSPLCMPSLAYYPLLFVCLHSYIILSSLYAFTRILSSPLCMPSLVYYPLSVYSIQARDLPPMSDFS